MGSSEWTSPSTPTASIAANWDSSTTKRSGRARSDGPLSRRASAPTPFHGGTDDAADSPWDGVDLEQEEAEDEDCRSGDDAREQGPTTTAIPRMPRPPKTLASPPVNAPVPAEPPATKPATKPPSNPASTYPPPSGSTSSPTAVASQRIAMTNPTPNPITTALQCTALTLSLIVQGIVRPELRWAVPLTG